MLRLGLSLLLASSATNALVTSYWVTQQIAKVNQAPLVDQAAIVEEAPRLEDLEPFNPPPLWPEGPPSEQDESPEHPLEVDFGPYNPPPLWAQGPPSAKARSPVSLLYNFTAPNFCTLENVAVRANGDLLMTATSQPGVWYYNPRNQRKAPALLKTFPNATSTLGIVELTEDFFIVAVGNYSASDYSGIPGTFTVWSVNLTESSRGSGPTFSKIIDLREATALNGMTTLEGKDDMVLISDSGLGAVWRVNVKTKKYEMAMQHVLFTNCTSTFPLGINGIRTYEQHLYFLNSAQKFYGRLSIDEIGNPTSEPEILARADDAVSAWDDVALDWEGNGWIATHDDMVMEVTVGGKQRSFTGDTDLTSIKEPTSIVWGRGSQAANKTLFVVTTGEGFGQIIALDTRMI